MACNTTNIYWSGNSFNAAVDLFTDAALTTPAPDGWYAVGGIYRQIIGGVLQAPTTCPACVIPCGGGFTASVNTSGRFTMYFDMGTVPGAGIITFSPGINNTTLFPIPDMCTWSYNGETASEYSSLVGGYQTGIIGAPDGPPHGGTQCPWNGQDLVVTTGTQGEQPTGIDYTYDASTGTFVAGPTVNIGATTGIIGFTGISNNSGAYQSTLLDWNCTSCWGVGGAPTTPTANCANGIGLDIPGSPYCLSVPIAPNLIGGPGTPQTNWPFAGGGYRGATMVVPSPPGVTNTILTIQVDAPCPNTWWGIDVRCPVELQGFQSTPPPVTPYTGWPSGGWPLGSTCGNVCGSDTPFTMYHAPVDTFGNSNPNSAYFANDQFPAAGPQGQAHGIPGLHDWVFEDPYGIEPMPVGVYKVVMPTDPANPGILVDCIVEVGVLDYTQSALDGGGVPHALPPETYNVQMGTDVQSSGTSTYIPGIIKSITKCSECC